MGTCGSRCSTCVYNNCDSNCDECDLNWVSVDECYCWLVNNDCSGQCLYYKKEDKNARTHQEDSKRTK